MGASEDEIGCIEQYDWPIHEVTITKPYYMSKYEVTQSQWEIVMGNNPAQDFIIDRGIGLNYPVYNMSWNDCCEFIEQIHLLNIGVFSFPAEAEWEYACRAGTSTRFFWGDENDYDDYSDRENPVICQGLNQHAWWWNNAKGKIHEVGQKQPNPWGLHGMPGNLWDWRQDLWVEPYEREPQTDPLGFSTGEDHVIRGGIFKGTAIYCRSACRSYHDPYSKGSLQCLRLKRIHEESSITKWLQYP